MKSDKGGKGMDKRARSLAVGLCLGLLAAVLLAALVPAPYCHPLVDDFGYGAPTYQALRAGLGLPGFLSALWENIRYTYENWQGTFASVLVFSIQPEVFAPGLYWLTPFVMLALTVAPVFLTLWAVKGMEGWGRLSVGALVSAVAVAYFPSPGQGLYWWNGGGHYVAFWFLAVVTFLLTLRLSRREPVGRPFWLRAAGCWLLAFLVGGGNYSTALVFPLAAGAMTLYYAIYDRRSRRVVAVNALTALWAGAGLLISMAAPGNAIRQVMKFTAMPALEAIFGSFRCAAEGLWRGASWPLAGALATATAVFLLTTRRSGYRFPLPGLVVGGGFCALAALYTPALYAMGVEWVPPRMENLMWLAGLLWLFGSAFYAAGWAARRYGLWEWPAAEGLLSAVGLTAFAGLLLALALGFEGTSLSTALTDLQRGVLADYRQTCYARQAVWEDKSVPAPRFLALEDIPTPGSFMPAAMLTWSPDVLVDGVASGLPVCRACGCEVNFVPLRAAVDWFGAAVPWREEDFPVTFFMGGEVWIPLRDAVDRAGWQVSYDLPHDTVVIQTRSGEEGDHGAP